MPSSHSTFTVIPRWDTDWILLLSEAVSRCTSVYAYPDQMMLCAGLEGNRLSFVHGVPGSDGLAAVNFAQDKRKRRALMESSNVPIPKGATFTFGRGRALAERFAERIGFPVVVKPALGDNGGDTILDIGSSEQFLSALEMLSTPPDERAHHTQSSYRLMLLDEPSRSGSGVDVPERYSFLVEEHIRGDLIRFLVSGGQIISAILCTGSPSDGSYTGGKDVLAEMTQEILNSVLHAASAVPGMVACAIDVVLPMPETPDSTTEPIVVDYHERFGLWVQREVDPQLADVVATKVFCDYAASQGVPLSDPEDNDTYFIRATSLPDVNRGAVRLAAIAASLELQEEVVTEDHAAGIVTWKVSGDPTLIAV